MVVAGEPSGDILGARLIEALRAMDAREIEFLGVGGPRMIEKGFSSLFPYADLAIMGLAEVLPRLGLILRRIRETAALAVERKVDAVITIDAPDFSFRVAARLRPLGIPLIHYVAPTVWAWRPGRAAKIARLYDHLFALLPFEPPYFERVGMPCSFVGHPVLESGADRGEGPAFRQRHGIGPQAPLLAVLPGSRRGEVSRLVGPFGQALARLKDRIEGLQVVVPTVPHIADYVRQSVAAWAVPTLVVEGDADKYGAFAASRAAMAASGTVAVELALARLPHLVAYRVNPLTAFIVGLVVRVRFANIVNLVLDRQVVPEFIQDRCRPDALAAEIERLMLDDGARSLQISAFAEAAGRLGAGAEAPSRKAARVVLEVIDKARARRLP